MTCWLCHGERDPTAARSCSGLPGAPFDYGLLLATAAVLDDGERRRRPRTGARAAFRRGARCARGCCWPGPGRQDLTGEFGLDVTVPGYHSARYAGTARVRQGTRGIVNPISVPGDPGRAGAGARELVRLRGRGGAVAGTAGRARRAPGAGRARGVRPARRRSRRRAARAAVRPAQPRARSGCSRIRFPGCCGPTRSTATPRCRAAATRGDPGDVRRRGGARACSPTKRRAGTARRRDDAATAASRAGARSSPSGSSARSPTARSSSARRAPTPRRSSTGRSWRRSIRRKPLDAKLAVRCADCHSARRSRTTRPLAENPPPLGRCTHCHVAHVARRRVGGDPRAVDRAARRCSRSRRSPLGSARAAGGGRVLRGVPREAPRLRAAGLLVEPPLPVRRRRRRRRAAATRPPIGAPAASAPSRCWPSTSRSRSGRSRSTSPSIPDPARARPRRPARASAPRWVRAAPLVAPARERALPAQRLGADAARAARAGRAPPGHASRSAPPASCSTRASPATATRATSSAPRSAAAEKQDLVAFLETL